MKIFKVKFYSRNEAEFCFVAHDIETALVNAMEYSEKNFASSDVTSIKFYKHALEV